MNKPGQNQAGSRRTRKAGRCKVKTSWGQMQVDNRNSQRQAGVIHRNRYRIADNSRGTAMFLCVSLV